MNKETMRIELTFSSGKFIAFRAMNKKDFDNTLVFETCPFDKDTIKKNEIHTISVMKDKLDFIEAIPNYGSVEVID